MSSLDRISGNVPTVGRGFSVYGAVHLTLVHIFVSLPLPAPSPTETTSTTIPSCPWKQLIVLVVVATWLPHPKNSCLYFESTACKKLSLIMYYDRLINIFPLY
jgi:hypothetical protein